MHYQQHCFSYYVSFLLFLFIALLLPSVPARNLPSQVMSPKNGVPDQSHDDHNKLHTTKRYSFLEGRPTWKHSKVPFTLSYALSPVHIIDYISISDIRVALERAFSTWSSVIPVNFTETRDYRHANIKIGFYYGEHGDGHPFDDTTLAHATGPRRNTYLHFNAGIRWAVDFRSDKSKNAYDLESIAVHEIGHVLGLNHSSIPEAIMWPYTPPRTKDADLALDDVKGAQALYGANPDFKLDSLKVKHLARTSGLREVIIGSVIGFSSVVALGILIFVCLFFWDRFKARENQIEGATLA